MNIDLYRFIENYGTKGGFIVILFFVFTTIIKSDWFGKVWIKMSERILQWFLKGKEDEQIKTINENDIVNHDIFTYIDFWIYSKIPTFKFSSEYRTVIFRKYLQIYLRCYKREISNYIKSGEYKKMTQSEFWTSMLSLINHIVWEYEKECLSNNIPKIVVDKMKSKNNETITLIIDLIESISNSSFYKSDNNYLKLYSILNILVSVLENTISNSETICNSINGELKGLTIIENGIIYKEGS